MRRSLMLTTGTLISASLLFMAGCPGQAAETADPVVEDSGVVAPAEEQDNSEAEATETPASNNTTSSSSNAGGGAGTPATNQPPAVPQNPPLPPFFGFTDEDLKILLENYLKAGGGDINGDGIVNQIDLGLLLQSYVPMSP